MLTMFFFMAQREGKSYLEKVASLIREVEDLASRLL